MAKTPKTRASRTVTLKIPAELFRNLTTLIKGTGFRSVTEFAIHVLRDIASGGALRGDSPGLTDREVDLVRKRLQALGYIE